MGWSIGYDSAWERDIGYGVPAWCDHPDCTEKIDRGLSYVCGQRPYGGDHGCGLYFCGNHLGFAYTADGEDDLKDENGEDLPQMCERCVERYEHPDDVGPDPTFWPKPDRPEWLQHKLTHDSWAEWRTAHPYHVAAMKLGLMGSVAGSTKGGDETMIFLRTHWAWSVDWDEWNPDRYDNKGGWVWRSIHYGDYERAQEEWRRVRELPPGEARNIHLNRRPVGAPMNWLRSS